MDQKTLVSAICDQADYLLAGVTTRTEAKAGMEEWLTINHPKLPPAERQIVIAQAMGVLDNEGFFETEAGGEA